MKPTLATIAVFVLLASCADLQAPGPTLRPAAPRVWDVPPSTLVVPFRVPQGAVGQWAESAVPPTLAGEGSGQRTLSAWFLKHDWHYWWTYRLVRTPFSLAFEGDRVRLTTTLTGTLEARWDTLPGDITSDVEADAGVEAHLAVAPDWRLAPATQTFLEVRRADVPIGIAWDGNFFGETISIAAPVQAALRPALVTLDGELDRWIAGLAVRPAAEGLWNSLQEPRSLGNDLWFTLGPQTVALGPVVPSADALSVDLLVTAKPGLTLGRRPDPARKPLPPATSAPGTPSKIVLNLPVTLEWPAVARQALDRLGTVAPVPLGPGGSIQVHGLEASTDGDRAVVKVLGKVSPPWPGPAVEAVVWLTGRPSWDPSTRTLRLTDVTLDVRTKDYLVKTASWLAGDAWVGALERAFVWDLGPALDQWKAQTAAALGGLDLGSHLTLAATVDSLEVVDFTLTDRGPEVLARVTGAATVHWVP